MGCLSNVILFPNRKKDSVDIAIECLFEQMTLIQSEYEIDWEEMMHICMVGMAKSAVNSGMSKEKFLEFCANIQIEEIDEGE